MDIKVAVTASALRSGAKQEVPNGRISDEPSRDEGQSWGSVTSTPRPISAEGHGGPSCALAPSVLPASFTRGPHLVRVIVCFASQASTLGQNGLSLRQNLHSLHRDAFPAGFLLVLLLFAIAVFFFYRVPF